ncbi:BON domain-containing protein [Chloroflexota bacterium]
MTNLVNYATVEDSSKYSTPTKIGKKKGFKCQPSLANTFVFAVRWKGRNKSWLALDARRITVATRGGKVILRENVCDWAEKEQAEWIVWAAPGVSEIENNIIISP